MSKQDILSPDTIIDAPTVNLTSTSKQSIMALKSLLLALVLENSSKGCKQVIPPEMHTLVSECDSNDIVTLTVDTKLVYGLRYTPLCLCIDMLKHAKHSIHVRHLLPTIIDRVDMITDALALYKTNNPCKPNKNYVPIARSLIIGLSRSFGNFNATQFASARSNSLANLREVMAVVRPKPKPEQEEVFRQIALGRVISLAGG